MRCILIDDEKHCLESLEIMIRRYSPELEIVAICEGGEAGIQAIETLSPELVFLDIAMPRMDGFQMLSQLSTYTFQLIFTTAYNEYAIEAFRVHAIDYLLKPVDRSELMAAIGRAKELKELATAKKAGDQLAEWLNQYGKGVAKSQISIPTMDGLEVIDTNRILYCLAEGNYSTLFLEGNKKRLISKNLGFLEAKLAGNSNFLRIHHSAIIHLGKVREYVRGKGGYVIMTDNRSIQVSRQMKQQLIDALG